MPNHLKLIISAIALIAEYTARDIDAQRVWPQSFDLNVIQHWLADHPQFGWPHGPP